MNQRLTEQRIRETCRELLARRDAVSGRALCAELKRRFGAVGKTERVFHIWRQEIAAATIPQDRLVLQRRLEAAQLAAAENLARAERAEDRERAHQDRWALEVDQLRQDLAASRGGVAIRKILPV